MREGRPGRSSQWYRVAGLRPTLLEGAQIHRHLFRGEVRYVLEDPTTGRLQRFTPTIYEVLQLFDGEHTLEEIYDLAGERLGEGAPSQQELIALLGSLRYAGALATPAEANADELLERVAKMRRTRFMGRLKNPLGLKIRVFDAGRLAEWGMRYLRPLFGWWGFLLWASIVTVGASLTLIHWEGLSEGALARVLADENLLWMWLVFPLVRALHELGHAYMTKALGGEVGEMGVEFLWLIPLPYVVTSPTSRFRLRRERVLVGLAGVMVELLVGTIALIAWVNLEPGLARSLAYDVLFTVGVSTIVFHLNPLLRYDGYFILVEMLGTPNLRARSQSYVLYWIERYLFAVPNRSHSALGTAERIWLVFFALGSFSCQALLVAGLLWVIATKAFVLGVILAAAVGIAGLLGPCLWAVKYLCTGPGLRPVRARALSISGALLGCLVLVPLWVPMPLNSMAEGVVWLPEEGIVRAQTEGWVAEELAASEEHVVRGQFVMRLENSDLRARLAVSRAHEEELQATILSHRPFDILSMEVAREELHSVQELVGELELEEQRLSVRSPGEGTFHLAPGPEYQGRFVERGEVLGTVMARDTWSVLVLVHQRQIDMLRTKSGRIDVRFADHLEEVYEAVLVRETPAASKQLPSGAFSTEGGGEVLLDPEDHSGRQARERWFQVELAVPRREGEVRVGGRAYVRFRHGFEPFGRRWYRSLRRLFYEGLDL